MGSTLQSAMLNRRYIERLSSIGAFIGATSSLRVSSASLRQHRRLWGLAQGDYHPQYNLVCETRLHTPSHNDVFLNKMEAEGGT